ncbi:MAG: site-specific integrase, partial [Gammaproteobacteria bacterium]|nr:site-specific integrase [Gammaproteobacteria bacterium]
LTESWLKANLNKVRTKKLIKVDRDGLNARLSPKGKITYMLRYYYNNNRHDLDIGTYPLMSLKEARAEVTRLRKKLEQGHNPKVVRQLERQAIIAAKSLQALFDLWYETYCIKNKKGHAEIKRSFEIHVFPRIGKLPAERVTLHEWLDILEGLAEKKPAIAERLLVNAKQMLKFAVKRKLIPSNPLSEIYAKDDLQIKKRAVDRTLSDEEIRMLWLAVDQSRITPKNKLFVKLCLIYGCRNGELRVAEKTHFDFNTMVWTIPPENHKLGKNTGKPLLRPITPSIEGYLKQAFALSGASKYVFTNDGSNEVMGLRAPLALPYNIIQHLRRHESYDLPHFSMHDLRRTARSNFSTLTEFHIAETMLGHSIGRIVQTYDKYDYLEEQDMAYEAWCERLYAIVGIGAAKDNLIQLDSWRSG